MTTCTATNCRVEAHCPAVVACDAPAVQVYELRPGVRLPVCQDAAKRLPADKLSDLGQPAA